MKEHRRTTGVVDARSARAIGRRPLKSVVYRCRTIEVYRVGRGYYQGLAIAGDGEILQAGRMTGPAASDFAGLAAAMLVDRAIDGGTRPLPSTDGGVSLPGSA